MHFIILKYTLFGSVTLYEPSTPSAGRSVGLSISWFVQLSVCRSVCHNFLKGQEITLPLLSEHLFYHVCALSWDHKNAIQPPDFVEPGQAARSTRSGRGGEIILSFCVIISIKSPKNEIVVEGFGGGSESWGGHLKSLRLPKYIHNLILQTKKSSQTFCCRRYTKNTTSLCCAAFTWLFQSPCQSA